MKKVLCLCLVLMLLLTLFGCGKKKSDAQTDFCRLSSVIIGKKEEAPQTYAVTWSENGCTFTAVNSGFGSHPLDAAFDTQTKTFFLRRAGEDVGVHCIFDDMGRIVRFQDIRKPQNGTNISYDEQGWPQVAEGELRNLKINKDNMQYSFIYTYGGITDSLGNIYTTAYTYRIVTLNKVGENTKVDHRIVTEYKDDGRIEETVQENFAACTYDAGGNLLRYEDDDIFVEFTYNTEAIHHNWERLIPLLCYDDNLIWVEPLFWNLK